jgi:hypothetical protein
MLNSSSLESWKSKSKYSCQVDIVVQWLLYIIGCVHLHLTADDK